MRVVPMFQIPQVLKDHGWLAIATGIGFLFAFYVNTTYARAEPHQQQHVREQAAVTAKIDGLYHRLETSRARERWELQVRDVRAQIQARQSRIQELELYMEFGSTGNNPARQQIVRKLGDEITGLEAELRVLLSQAPAAP